MEQYKCQPHPCYGVVVNGMRHEIDEFNQKQVEKLLDIIDHMAESDKFLYECTLDAEGDDNEEYLCDLVDNWYKNDIVIAGEVEL